MKKKIIALLLCSALAVSVTACGGSNEPKDNNSSKTEESKKDKPEKKEEVKEDDGIIDFSTDNFNAKYVKHEFGTDYEGNKTLLYYYTFTNNSDENTAAGMSAHIQCFQDGSECEMAIMSEYTDSMNNYAVNEVQPGGTVEVCQTFKLKSDTEMTIEASDLMAFDNEKDSQKIVVE